MCISSGASAKGKQYTGEYWVYLHFLFAWPSWKGPLGTRLKDVHVAEWARSIWLRGKKQCLDCPLLCTVICILVMEVLHTHSGWWKSQHKVPENPSLGVFGVSGLQTDGAGVYCSFGLTSLDQCGLCRSGIESTLVLRCVMDRNVLGYLFLPCCNFLCKNLFHWRKEMQPQIKK